MMGAVLLIAACIALYYGANYFALSATSNSAIHEIAGLLGITAGVTMIGLAVVLWTLSGLGGRLARLEAAERRNRWHLVKPLVDRNADAIRTLWALATVRDGQLGKHLDRIVDYVAAREQQKLAGDDRDLIANHIAQLHLTEAEISQAVTAAASRADERLFAVATAIVGSRKDPTARQRAILDYLRAPTEPEPV